MANSNIKIGWPPRKNKQLEFPESFVENWEYHSDEEMLKPSEFLKEESNMYAGWKISGRMVSVQH